MSPRHVALLLVAVGACGAGGAPPDHRMVVVAAPRDAWRLGNFADPTGYAFVMFTQAGCMPCEDIWARIPDYLRARPELVAAVEIDITDKRSVLRPLHDLGFGQVTQTGIHETLPVAAILSPRGDMVASAQGFRRIVAMLDAPWENIGEDQMTLPTAGAPPPINWTGTVSITRAVAQGDEVTLNVRIAEGFYTYGGQERVAVPLSVTALVAENEWFVASIPTGVADDGGEDKRWRLAGPFDVGLTYQGGGQVDGRSGNIRLQVCSKNACSPPFTVPWVAEAAVVDPDRTR